MADMIIKPSDGNSLVFQDEGGDPAITVGTTGNTTLAGTANALGTVATGNINALYGGGGVQEYSRGAYTGLKITINTATAYNPGMYAKLNPASSGDMCIVNYHWSWQDPSTMSAQDHRLLVDGTEHFQWGDHFNHSSATGKYSSSDLWAVRTASEFGWSSGTITFGITTAGQSSTDLYYWNDDCGGNAEDGFGGQMTFIQAWRYPSTAITAGTNV